MKMSLNLLNYFKDNKRMQVFEVPVGHYNFEYSIQTYNDVSVFGIVELENEIISDIDNKIIGYFGINFEHNILAYYLR